MVESWNKGQAELPDPRSQGFWSSRSTKNGPSGPGGALPRVELCAVGRSPSQKRCFRVDDLEQNKEADIDWDDKLSPPLPRQKVHPFGLSLNVVTKLIYSAKGEISGASMPKWINTHRDEG